MGYAFGAPGSFYESCLVRICHRKGEIKARTAITIRSGPQATAMGFKNRAADRQPHPATLRFGREKRLEDLFLLRCRQARATVADRNLQQPLRIQPRLD